MVYLGINGILVMIVASMNNELRSPKNRPINLSEELVIIIDKTDHVWNH